MERLYYKLPYIKEFEAEVLECREGKKGTYHVILDRTAFFPEGGGQPGDSGMLGEAIVMDTHEKDGKVYHITDRPILTGERVKGSLDWEKRFHNMQGHSGEHILTGLIHKKFGFDNVGFHMGKEEITIDFNGIITMEELHELEFQANEAVYENLPFIITCPSQEELQKMEYRSKKELSGEVRIVTIPGVDVCACCGTHVERTGEIGLIKVLGMIHYKGGIRISMLCGKPALVYLDSLQSQMNRMSVLLSAKLGKIEETVEKLKHENMEKEARLTGAFQELFAVRTKGYPDSGQPLVLFEEGMSPIQLRQFCTLLYEKGKGSVVIVCGEKDGSFQYAAGSSTVDMKEFAKKANSILNGRGGGSRQMAQGTFQASREEIVKAVEDLMCESNCDIQGKD
ncbi:DHHA1 domain-containing protein [Lachnospiraceae bacterium 62-35]